MCSKRNSMTTRRRRDATLTRRRRHALSPRARVLCTPLTFSPSFSLSIMPSKRKATTKKVLADYSKLNIHAAAALVRKHTLKSNADGCVMCTLQPTERGSSHRFAWTRSSASSRIVNDKSARCCTYPTDSRVSEIHLQVHMVGLSINEIW